MGNAQSDWLGNGEFAIRRAVPADAEGVAACLAAAFSVYRNDYTPAAFADTVLTPEGVCLRMREMSLFVAVLLGEVIGTIACKTNGRDGHLRGMAVLPSWQGLAVASKLLQTAEAELRANGCESVTLDTTGPLRRAMRFYERHGFSSSGRVSDFFGMRLFEYSKVLL